MSTAAVGSTNLTDSRKSRQADKPRPRIFPWVVIIGDVAVLGSALFWGAIHLPPFPDLILWGLLVAVSGAITVTKEDFHLGFDLPVLLAAGLVFGPLAAGLLGLLAVFDVREFRREVSPELALFNRAEISISAMAGAAVFWAISPPLTNFPWTAIAGLLALTADVAVNYCLVAAHCASRTGRPLLQVASEMRFGPARYFVPTYACFGFMGVLIAEAYLDLGIVGVVGFVGPVLIARQAFSHRKLLDRANDSLGVTQRALDQLDRQVAKERKDERLTLAGELHDEILPPLFQVHLMAQVLKQDLITGRLLDLDEDLPVLIQATEIAQSATRGLVRNLRHSSLGALGLVPTVRLLAQQLETSGSPRILLHLKEVTADPASQLLAYQVIREAMTNAARYSKAQLITAHLESAEGKVRVSVVDDGVGFDPRGVDLDDHFGLQFIAERVQAAGGEVIVDSRMGFGTSILASIPSGAR